MFYKIKRYFRKFKNFIKWIPIVWNDEQWEESYLFKIIKFKFELMEKHFNNPDECWIIDSDRKQIAFHCKTCKLLCERLIDDVYWDLQNDKWLDYSAAQQDIDLLTSIIRKHIFTWWD